MISKHSDFHFQLEKNPKESMIHPLKTSTLSLFDVVTQAITLWLINAPNYMGNKIISVDQMIPY
jgi:hypothetical protein